MVPIVNSILDTDMSKILLQNAVLNTYPDAMATYCLSKPILNKYIPDIECQISFLSEVKATPDEMKFLSNIYPALSDAYLVYLKNFTFSNRNIIITQIDSEFSNITVSGRWADVCMIETPLLSIINEVILSERWGSSWGYSILSDMGYIQGAMDVINRNGISFIDNLTRRRYTGFLQEFFIRLAKTSCSKECFLGTANPFYSKKIGVALTGGLSREWELAHNVLSEHSAVAIDAFGIWKQSYLNSTIISPVEDVSKAISMCSSLDIGGFYYRGTSPIDYINELIEYSDIYNIEISDKVIVFSDKITLNDILDVKEHIDSLPAGKRPLIKFQMGLNLLKEDITSLVDRSLELVSINGMSINKVEEI